MTSVRDGRAHLVGTRDVEAGSERGEFPALCGHLVAAAALATAPGPACIECHSRPHRQPGRSRVEG